jgi:hypothetical protein
MGKSTGKQKGCHRQIPGKKKGFVTTAPHSFLFHRCHFSAIHATAALSHQTASFSPPSSVTIRCRCLPPPILPSTTVCHTGIRPRHICPRHPPLLPTPVLPTHCKVSFFCNFFPPPSAFSPGDGHHRDLGHSHLVCATGMHWMSPLPSFFVWTSSGPPWRHSCHRMRHVRHA